MSIHIFVVMLSLQRIWHQVDPPYSFGLAGDKKYAG